MGGEHSIQDKPTAEAIDQIALASGFTKKQINKLWNKFESVSNSIICDNKIDIQEFNNAMCIKSTGFGKRIFSAFDKDNSNDIDFKEFVMGVAALAPTASVKTKARFCFDVYDIDRNGYIEIDELKEVLLLSLQQNTEVHITASQLDKIVKATYKKMDLNGDGLIDFNEFEIEAKKNSSILNCANIDIDALLK